MGCLIAVLRGLLAGRQWCDCLLAISCHYPITLFIALLSIFSVSTPSISTSLTYQLINFNTQDYVVGVRGKSSALILYDYVINIPRPHYSPLFLLSDNVPFTFYLYYSSPSTFTSFNSFIFSRLVHNSPSSAEPPTCPAAIEIIGNQKADYQYRPLKCLTRNPRHPPLPLSRARRLPLHPHLPREKAGSRLLPISKTWSTASTRPVLVGP